MHKLTALLCVISWSGFWAFGYLALSSIGSFTQAQVATAALIAFVGMITGGLSYLRLIKLSETTGYAPKTNQLDANARQQAHLAGSH